MQITYDKEANAISITLNETGQYHASRQISDSFILDMDAEGKIIAIEILHASKYVTHPDKVDFVDITRREEKSL